MAKNHKKRNRRKRHYKRREQIREVRAESYYKRQADIINSLKPVMATAKRFNERAAQIARDLRNAAQAETEKGGAE